MEPVLTPEAMGRADKRTIDAGTPVAVLMERAGRAVAWEVRRVLSGCYGRRAFVPCGKGNNGGDGLVTARALSRWGVQTHAEQLVPAIRYLCDELGVPLDRLAAVAVDVGPGLFTGLRVGVTTAKVMRASVAWYRRSRAARTSS